jgi:hypothetical protein
MHLIADELAPPGQAALAYFDPPDRRLRAEAVARVKERINGKVGRFAVRSAATLYLPAIYADVANSYDICDVRDKMCF